jgi:ABC-type branched-subunit amino acid transport system ATPase component
VDKEARALLDLGERHLIMVKGRIVFSGTSGEWRAQAEENLALLRA